jgi:hypothetical protein
VIISLPSDTGAESEADTAWKRWKRLVEMIFFYQGIRRPAEELWGYLCARASYLDFLQSQMNLLVELHGGYAWRLGRDRPELITWPQAMINCWKKMVSKLQGRLYFQLRRELFG